MLSRLLTLILIALISNALSAANPGKVNNVIPAPRYYTQQKGTFKLLRSTRILVNSNSPKLINIGETLGEGLGINAQVEVMSKGPYDKQTIILKLEEIDSLGHEGYILNVRKSNISITANSPAGIFYGIQTLMQLLPDLGTRLSDDAPQAGIRCCDIVDFPRFSYRGMHLDVCRHMFPVSFIKKYIDLMSYYKLSTFHWHLTEDQGWRIEIKKYPLLTEIGGYRNSSPIGKSQKNDNQRYGGFYTQDEAREIVAYAAERNITVIPEIEMPGHSVAALSAYPQYSCTGGPFDVYTRWGVSEDVFCAGQDQTFSFIEDILTEIMLIFPSTLIHIGGDEVPKTRWNACPRCQSRMKTENLASAEELQSYFIKRIEHFLNEHGRQIIGWDEILEGGLAPGATVMSWRGTEGGIEAAKMKHNVIMTPGSPCYFDHYQGDPHFEPLAIGGYNPLRKVYSYEPLPASLSADESKFILGCQGNVWTEYIADTAHVEYMAFPRGIALAEVNWTVPEQKDWNDFERRFTLHQQYLNSKNVNYSKSTYNVTIKTQIDTIRHKGTVVLSSDIPGKPIYYSTIDNVKPGKRYKKPFIISKTSVISANQQIANDIFGNTTTRKIYVHAAFAKPVRVTGVSDSEKLQKKAFILTDGCRAENRSADTSWLKIEKSSINIEIDLGKKTMLNDINIGAFYAPSSGVFLPEAYTFELSDDGNTYTEAPGFHPDLLTIREAITVDYTLTAIKREARFIRIILKNREICPEGTQQAGNNAWIFLDEIMVNRGDEL